MRCNNMSAKLWQTPSTTGLHPVVEAYTVGGDYLLDQRLLGYDIQASKAHVSMLHSIGILTSNECTKLAKALGALHQKWAKGEFLIQKDHEDGHTAIEAYLVEELGDIGKKIHTARSRNDQALVMMRLYLKDNLWEVRAKTSALSAIFGAASQQVGDTPMPGYTHMQKAMPTTVACWLNSYADAFADAGLLTGSTLKIIDQNPLGSAAGFGISLPIDREHTTKTLGFNKTQENSMYCGLSRGLFELLAVQSLNPLMILAGKFAADMMLFTTQEFDLFSLPDSFTTGSSIMPHKHNFDLFEIMRGHAHTFGAYSQQLQSLASSAGSGYHRDLQLTKDITLQAFSTTLATLEVLELVVPSLRPHKDKLAKSVTPEMQSVAEINKLVGQGIPFRDAYVQIKNSLN
jgi:argininosuccinate lyase